MPREEETELQQLAREAGEEGTLRDMFKGMSQGIRDLHSLAKAYSKPGDTGSMKKGAGGGGSGKPMVKGKYDKDDPSAGDEGLDDSLTTDQNTEGDAAQGGDDQAEEIEGDAGYSDQMRKAREAGEGKEYVDISEWLADFSDRMGRMEKAVADVSLGQSNDAGQLATLNKAMDVQSSALAQILGPMRKSLDRMHEHLAQNSGGRSRVAEVENRQAVQAAIEVADASADRYTKTRLAKAYQGKILDEGNLARYRALGRFDDDAAINETLVAKVEEIAA